MFTRARPGQAHIMVWTILLRLCRYPGFMVDFDVDFHFIVVDYNADALRTLFNALHFIFKIYKLGSLAVIT